ncbi:MAG: hypothetical protein EP329_05190 [Deltaproteobacteria bacterium]|nr:MAG: hypothetical protein EP329_05190 [Deltaproteobacteria bacterium]
MRSRRSGRPPGAALALLVLVAGCGESARTGAADTAVASDVAGPDGAIEDDAFGVDALDALEDTADDDEDGQGGEDAVPAPLSIIYPTFLPSDGSPLAGVLSFTTDRPARVAVTVVGPDGGEMLVPTTTAALARHDVWVLGLWFDERFTLRVAATAEDDGATAEASLLVNVPAAPAYLPRYTRVAGDDEAPPAGLTLTLPRSASAAVPGGLLVAVDAQGRIRWLYTQTQQIRDARLTARGTLLVADRSGLTERDVTGRALRHVARTDLGADTLHHAVLELPDGHLLALTTELRTIDGYPAGTPGGTTQNVVGDRVLDVTWDGGLAASWALLDLLDPYRVAQGFLAAGYDGVYPDATPTRDWSHANALAWDASRDAMLVTLRHQHQVVAIERTSGAVRWTLGVDGDFPLAPPATWFYGPHAAELTADGHVLLFDNGFGRPAVEGGSASRVVEVAFDDGGDRDAWSAEVVWEWWGDVPFYSPSMGDADRLDGGNVLVTVSQLLDADTQRSTARLVEVTHEAAPRIVWDVRVDHPDYGFQVYQSDRIGGLYPPTLLAPP